MSTPEKTPESDDTDQEPACLLVKDLDWNDLSYVASGTFTDDWKDVPPGSFCRVIGVSDTSITLCPAEHPDEPHETNIPLAHHMADCIIRHIVDDLEDLDEGEAWEYLTRIGGRILRIIDEGNLHPDRHE